LIEGVQDEASCIDSDKVTCETPPSILKRLKEDKPLVVHRFHKRQMSLGDTHQKVPAPVSRSNTSKYLRMDKNIVDTTTPIESVNVVASKFGGNMNWKTRKTQTTHASDRIVLELDKMKNKISECKHQAEAAEAAKLSVLKEVERTKKLIDEMKHVLEREQAKEVDAKDDLELFQIISQAMEGVDCNDSVVEDYDSLLIETDISINKRDEEALNAYKTYRFTAQNFTAQSITFLIHTYVFYRFHGCIPYTSDIYTRDVLLAILLPLFSQYLYPEIYNLTHCRNMFLGFILQIEGK
ncbi:hypothetical protein ACJX0J_023936, partial [Zea mays]